VARVVPARPALQPDFLARAKAIWGELPPGKPLGEVVAEARGVRAVTYLDTGCLVTLYYPEPDSEKVIVLKVLAASEFITTDGRQKNLASAMGLNLITF